MIPSHGGQTGLAVVKVSLVALSHPFRPIEKKEMVGVCFFWPLARPSRWGPKEIWDVYYMVCFLNEREAWILCVVTDLDPKRHPR
jgi:hypothetical protein